MAKATYQFRVCWTGAIRPEQAHASRKSYYDWQGSVDASFRAQAQDVGIDSPIDAKKVHVLLEGRQENVPLCDLLGEVKGALMQASIIESGEVEFELKWAYTDSSNPTCVITVLY